jgi:hypothetical protein
MMVRVMLMPEARKILPTKECFSGVQHCKFWGGVHNGTVAKRGAGVSGAVGMMVGFILMHRQGGVGWGGE